MLIGGFKNEWIVSCKILINELFNKYLIESVQLNINLKKIKFIDQDMVHAALECSKDVLV